MVEDVHVREPDPLKAPVGTAAPSLPMEVVLGCKFPDHGLAGTGEPILTAAFDSPPLFNIPGWPSLADLLEVPLADGGVKETVCS